MKIISIGNFGYGWDGSICDEEHVAGALENMGHTVQRVSRTSVALGIPDSLTFPDFILIAQWDGYPTDFISKLREKYACLIVYVAFDYQADGQEWHEDLVNGVDLYLSKRMADSRYPNWRWWSQDFAPMFLDMKRHGGATSVPEIPKSIDVLFTGTYLPWAEERNKILKAVDEKFNLTIHAVNPDDWKVAGFKNVNGPVMDEQLPGLIVKAKINLSIDHTYETGYWSDRNAQIMASGGLVLFRYVPFSEVIFKHYINYFYNEQTCLQQIERLLKSPEHREQTAAAGYRYAQQNLMVRNRVIEMFNIIGSIIA